MTKTESSWSKLNKTALLSQQRTMHAKSILKGSLFSPFSFHSKFICHRAKGFGACGENYGQSVDTEESQSICKETKFCFRLDHLNRELWSYDSFCGHQWSFLCYCIVLFDDQSCGCLWQGNWEGKEMFLFSASSFYNPHWAVRVGGKEMLSRHIWVCHCTTASPLTLFNLLSQVL